MTRRTLSLRSSGPWVVLLALIGLWLSHSAEVVLVSRHHGLAGELWEPVDMLPMGAVLALLATAAGARFWWLWLRTSRRLDVARQQSRELPTFWCARGAPPGTPPPTWAWSRRRHCPAGPRVACWSPLRWSSAW